MRCLLYWNKKTKKAAVKINERSIMEIKREYHIFACQSHGKGFGMCSNLKQQNISAHQKL